jgi:triosephosphate isomerase
MRKKIVAGNWKMNLSLQAGEELIKGILKRDKDPTVSGILIPSFVHLSRAASLIKDTPLHLGAQNNHPNKNGAFTGEVSAPMLKSVGVEYVLVGHSERRSYFHENNPQLRSKVKALLEAEIKPIFCCGESLEDRNRGKHFEAVADQLEVVWSLDPKEFEALVIAYEPVWAIGTGKTASVDQAQEMHSFIRAQAQKHFGQLAETTSILYGGSCKPDNAKMLFSQNDVDGGLIGGASLKADDFVAIINSF